MAAKKYYAVKKGKSTGIFQSWEECRASVEGYPGAVYKGFPGLEEAEGYLGLAPGTGKISGGRSGSGARAKAPGQGEFEGVRYMHIMGCSLMSSPVFAREILKAMRMLAGEGSKISFDPNIRKELFTDASIHEVIREVMEHTSIFLPGVEELLLITGKENVEEAVKTCFTYPRMEILVLKNGSKGSRIYQRSSVEEVGVYQVEQADATGAGDCFDGAFLAGLVQGKSVKEAAQMGAAAGLGAAAGPRPRDERSSTTTSAPRMAAGHR